MYLEFRGHQYEARSGIPDYSHGGTRRDVSYGPGRDLAVADLHSTRKALRAEVGRGCSNQAKKLICPATRDDPVDHGDRTNQAEPRSEGSPVRSEKEHETHLTGPNHLGHAGDKQDGKDNCENSNGDDNERVRHLSLKVGRVQISLPKESLARFASAN
jgi:hypothetical protein